MTTDNFAAFPDAPVPTTLRGALDMLEETRRLLAEECRQRAEVQDTLRAIICERDEWRKNLAAILGCTPDMIEPTIKTTTNALAGAHAMFRRANDARDETLAERDVLRRAFEHLRGMIEGIIDTDDLLALRDTVGETCNEVGLRRGLNHETGEPDYQWVAVT